MKNFVQEDDVITVIAPYAVSSGDGVLVGTMFGVAKTDALIGALVAIITEGVVDIKKATGESWTEGEAIYWHDGTVKQATATSSGNTKIGVAVIEDASGTLPGTNDATGFVRLNGSF